MRILVVSDTHGDFYNFKKAVDAQKNADVIINNDGTTSFIPNENIFIAATAVAVVIFIFIPFINKIIKKEKQYDI